MKRILLITGLLVTLSVSGSALKVIGKIYHFKGIKQQGSDRNIAASMAAKGKTEHEEKSPACGYYHRKTYE